MRSILDTTRKFYSYQKERFPIAILGLSLIPAALSSGVIVSVNPTVIQVMLVVIASLAYLLHIRVIAVIAGRSALITALIMLVYSFLAGREFFVGEKIRRRFFIYNGANLVQMLLMQLFVYSIFANPIPINTLIVIHFLFTTVGTIVFEFVRKLKIPGRDGTGKDTYTWYLGFNNAMAIYLFLVLLNSALFLKIAAMLSSHLTGLFIFSACAGLLVSFAVLIHWLKKTHKTDQLMQLSFLVMYGVFNLMIYFLAR